MKKVIILVMVCLLLVGCGKEKAAKVSKEISDFNKVCNDNGYMTSDNMSSYAGDTYITGASICKLTEGEMEMVVYDSAEKAKKIQDHQIEQFKLLKSLNNVTNDDEGENYYKHTMISNGYYMVTSRIDNTLIFTKIILDEKDNIDVMLNSLGY